MSDPAANEALRPWPRWTGILFALAVAFILWFTFQDIGEPLLDRHSHRQTQTAISVEYMLRDGAWFPYITPVLGPPWAIPMEFPLYQWVVAGIVKMTGAPLELTGRLVSLLFWWLVLCELFRALRYFVPDGRQRAALLLVVAAAPASIYWSRSFMIETCALYLAVGFARQVLRAVWEEKRSAWIWAVVMGTLAALQKITTLFIVEVLLAMILLGVLVRARRDAGKRSASVRNLACFILLGVWTLVVALAWTGWADKVKEHNAIARDLLTSEALKNWNYGTVEQRVSGDTWRHLVGNVTLGFTGRTPGVGYKVPLVLWVMMVFAARRRMGEQAVLLGAFMAGPLVFMNLYHIHEYYFVANGFLLLLAVGWAGLAGREDARPGMRWASVVFWIVIIVGQLWAYPRYHSLLMAEVPERAQFETEFRQMLDARMEPGEVLLVYGRDWDPAVAFYGGRKAIIDPFSGSPEDQRTRELLGHLKPEESIGAMIVAGHLRTNAVFVRARTVVLGLEEAPQASYWGDVYFRKQTDPGKEKASR